MTLDDDGDMFQEDRNSNRLFSLAPFMCFGRYTFIRVSEKISILFINFVPLYRVKMNSDSCPIVDSELFLPMMSNQLFRRWKHLSISIACGEEKIHFQKFHSSFIHILLTTIASRLHTSQPWSSKSKWLIIIDQARSLPFSSWFCERSSFRNILSDDGEDSAFPLSSVFLLCVSLVSISDRFLLKFDYSNQSNAMRLGRA